jgi:hypothetical protein
MGPRRMVSVANQLLQTDLLKIINPWNRVDGMSMRRLTLLAWGLCACSGKEKPNTAIDAGASGATGTPALAAGAVYRLVMYDNLPVPAYDSSPMPAGCSLDVHSGEFSIDSTRWHFTEQFGQGCGQNRTPRSEVTDTASGRVQRKQDTLDFQFRDSTQGSWDTYNRGVIHGDSLITGGPLFDGPQRVYVRRR